ncbi:MAG: acyltransferase [Proteobacteria bacterium]|uniref:acyltransferase family protein n=1 Tax=Rudaea sp. TaxID=2136325 RepID=UPI00321FB7DD|nr:acyltransferase [Pseudomonadota bacterium]
MTAPSIKKPFYLPELDILRAGAFFAVFISHWAPEVEAAYLQHGLSPLLAHSFYSLTQAGGAGVLLFFCLSSYLITKLLLGEIAANGSINVGAFYLRRILRIWPLYLLFTAFAALLPFVDPEQRFGPRDILAFLFFCGNWLWALHCSLYTVASPLWSVSVEEQFYLCWPWVIRRSTPVRIQRIAIWLLVIAALNRVLVVTGIEPTTLRHNTLTQLDSIALGALLALGVDQRGDDVRRRHRFLIIAIAAASILLNKFLLGDNDPGPYSLVYYPMVSLACAVILWATLGVELRRDSAPTRLLIFLGTISYGLYVVHHFALYAVDALYARLPHIGFIAAILLRGVAAMALTIGLAMLSYRFLERPFLRLKSRFER